MPELLVGKRRGAFFGLDAVERCQFLLHENPKDLDRFVTDAAMHGLTIINLLAYSAQDIEAMLSK